MRSDSIGRRRRRGMALLLVLGVVAVASILGWAMLSSAAMRAQVEATTADSTDASYLAESGISYAMYYLYNPAKSPVAVRQGTYNAYFPGQAGLTMWSDAKGTVDTSVTNTGDGQFSITSGSTVNGIRRTLVADAAYSYDRYTVTHALAVNGEFTVPKNMTVNGPVVNRDVIDGHRTNCTNSGPMTPTRANVTPTWSQLTLAVETGTAATRAGRKGTDRAYTYDGRDYSAEPLTGSLPNNLTTSDPASNPLNVWYSDGDLKMTGVMFNGTIIVRNTKKLTVTNENTITPKAVDMPALIVDTIDMKQDKATSRLTVNGVLWVDNKITNSGPYNAGGWLKVNGALLFGGDSPTVDAVNLGIPITVVYAPAVAKIPALSTVKRINGIAIKGWRQGG